MYYIFRELCCVILIIKKYRWCLPSLLSALNIVYCLLFDSPVVPSPTATNPHYGNYCCCNWLSIVCLYSVIKPGSEMSFDPYIHNHIPNSNVILFLHTMNCRNPT